MYPIAIVADFVCPWCFIGKRRLERAVALVRAERPDFAYSTQWKPFFLNPNTPPEGEPYLPFLVEKFGSKEAVEALFERVRDAGQAYGLEYAFEKIALRANTLQAHRLVRWAQAQGSADRLVERLFVAQFQNGEAISHTASLIRIAGEVGLSEAAVEEYLATNLDTNELRAEEQRIRAMGIRMVPTFILPGNEVIVGAEDPRILASAILRQLHQGVSG